MALDYDNIANRVRSALQRVGMPVEITRDGAAVGSGYGVFVKLKDNFDGTEPLMQTTAKNRVLKLTAIESPPFVGDEVTIGDDVLTVTSVEAHRPTATTVAYTLELA